MMKLSRYAAILALGAFATQACAQVKAAPGDYVWYDGGKPRQLQLDSTVVAEFGDRAEAGGEPVMRGSGVRIWRRQDQAATRAAAGGAASPAGPPGAAGCSAVGVSRARSRGTIASNAGAASTGRQALSGIRPASCPESTAPAEEPAL